MTGRGEDFTTGSLLDYDYWKNNYKLICCDLSKQKVLDSNPKANQQIEFVYKLDNTRTAPGTKAQILTVLEKEKVKVRSKRNSKNLLILQYKMVQYNKVNLHLTNLQLKKIANAVKNNNGTIIRLNNKNFNKDQLLHELYLTQRQMTKLIDKIKNNMSTDIKLSKVQINKIIKEGGNLGKLLMSFLPKPIKPAISLGKNILAPLGLSAAMLATDATIQLLQLKLLQH